jgi:hypothetical protein
MASKCVIVTLKSDLIGFCRTHSEGAGTEDSGIHVLGVIRQIFFNRENGHHSKLARLTSDPPLIEVDLVNRDGIRRGQQVLH